MSLTPRQLMLVCALIQRDPPDPLLPRIGQCLTAGRLARAFLARDPDCGPLSEANRAALEDIARCETLSALKVIDYINKNSGNGFVAFAFQGPHGVVCAFRGSESTLYCAPSDVDWLDNVRAPFRGSIQYPSARKFVAPYAEEALMLTGHSKGAHNALYALATSDNPRALCRCFDGQGFSPGQLTRLQRAILSERGINYVQQFDIVGAILCHPEKRIFVKSTGVGHPHSLSSLAFGSDGEPLPAWRSLRSRAIGVASCAIAATAQA